MASQVRASGKDDVLPSPAMWRLDQGFICPGSTAMNASSVLFSAIADYQFSASVEFKNTYKSVWSKMFASAANYSNRNRRFRLEKHFLRECFPFASGIC